MLRNSIFQWLNVPMKQMYSAFLLTFYTVVYTCDFIVVRVSLCLLIFETPIIKTINLYYESKLLSILILLFKLFINLLLSRYIL